jgi:heptaprenyl diphosphate synthase
MNVTPSHPRSRRSGALRSIGLGERLFASSAERKLANELDAGLDEVERGLLAHTDFADAMADVTGRYLLEAGGKRVRPVLTLLCAQLGEGTTPEALTAAQVVELTHLASLYHDDVMDEAELRRGVPTAQAVWGNSVAILTGDLLFARASLLAAGLGDDAIREQALTFERLVLGQLHETIGPREGDDVIAHYLQVLADKTGSLIATAASLGLRFGNGPVEFAPALREFGEKIGVAFQLVDDVIDLSDRAETTGKAAGTDLRSGVATLPLLYLRASDDAADAALLARIERAIQAEADRAAAEPGASTVAVDEGDFAAAVAELRTHAVTEATMAEARRRADEAVAALAPLPAGAVRTALERFAASIVERDN